MHRSSTWSLICREVQRRDPPFDNSRTESNDREKETMHEKKHETDYTILLTLLQYVMQRVTAAILRQSDASDR